VRKWGPFSAAKLAADWAQLIIGRGEHFAWPPRAPIGQVLMMIARQDA